ncbi:unnamed protein product, partial [Acidithrix sp. C25]
VFITLIEPFVFSDCGAFGLFSQCWSQLALKGDQLLLCLGWLVSV